PPNRAAGGWKQHSFREIYMFGLLVRFLGSGANRGRSARVANAQRFGPRLEVLDGRGMPSTSGAGVDVTGCVAGGSVASATSGEVDVRGAVSGGVIQAPPLGGASGGVLGDGSISPIWLGEAGGAAGGIVMGNIGEEIPSGGGEIHTQAEPQHIGEEIP